jgi:hypothetical protein
LLLTSASAFADKTVLDCQVSNGTVVVTLQVTLGDDQSIDFLTINLNEKSGQSVFFSQFEKGEFAKQIASNSLNVLALTEQTAQPDGVITNAGFMALGKADDSAAFTGFLAAKGNIYPLNCKGTGSRW